jgi:hypothetical protein
MNLRPLVVLAILQAMASGVLAQQPAAQQPDAQAILQRARLATSLQHADLIGAIRKDNRRVPVKLFLKGENIQFQIDGAGIFHLRLQEDRAQLFDVEPNGKTTLFPAAKLSERIAASDLTYEDLSMRFFYWPNALFERIEKVGGQDCFRLLVVNPGKEGSYASVNVWVHTKAGAFMKVTGYDRAGRPVKTFEVKDLQAAGGGEYTLKSMSVETIDPASLRVLGRSYLDFDNPKGRAAPRGLR